MSLSAPESAVQVSVKLTSRTDRSELIKTLSAWPGVKEVVQTFPEEDDPELSCLYVLKLNPSAVTPVLRQLRENPDIEYVEEPAPRKLIW